MNFYKHHIGDYAQATAHLTFVEDSAYSRLLRKYYAEEKPIPSDLRAAQRLVGARTKEERAAVETVLGEFFVLEADGWHNKRADEELGRWQAQAEANRKVAEEREAKKRARLANATVTNRGGAGNDSSNDSFGVGKHESLPSREPNQKPEARSQKEAFSPDTLSHTTPSAAVSGQFEGHERPSTTPNPAAPHAIALNHAGFRCTGMNPELVAFVEAGGTVEHLQQVATLPECAGKPAGYVVKIARRELVDRAAAITPSTNARSNGQPSKTLQGIARLEALKNGNQPELAVAGDRVGPAEAVPALPRQVTGNGRD